MVNRYEVDLLTFLNTDGAYVLYTDYVELERSYNEIESLLKESMDNTERVLAILKRWGKLNDSNQSNS